MNQILNIQHIELNFICIVPLTTDKKETLQEFRFTESDLHTE